MQAWAVWSRHEYVDGCPVSSHLNNEVATVSADHRVSAWSDVLRRRLQQVPSEVRPALQAAGVSNLADLLDLKVGELSGPSQEELALLREYRVQTLSEVPLPPPLHLGVPEPEHWADTALPPAPRAIQNVLAGHGGLETFSDLHALDVSSLLVLRGVGRLRVLEVAVWREEVLCNSRAFATPEELLTSLWERWDDRECLVIREYYLGGRTLQAIGDDLGITREWVRQIIARALRRGRALVEQPDLPQRFFGVGESTRLVDATTLQHDSKEALLLLRVLTSIPWVLVDDRWLWRGLSTALYRSISKVGALLDHRACLEQGRVEQLAADGDLAVSEIELLMEHRYGWVQQQDGWTIDPDESRGLVWVVWYLWSQGGPVSLDDLARSWADHRGSAPGPSARRITAKLLAYHDAYRVAETTFVHELYLGYPVQRMEALVAWCASILEGERGAWGLPRLLELAASAGLDTTDVTPFALKSALCRHPGVKQLPKSHVAWEATYSEDGVLLADRMEAVLSRAEEPLTVVQIHDRLPKRTSYSLISVQGALYGTDRFARQGKDRWTLPSRVEPKDSAKGSEPRRRPTEARTRLFERVVDALADRPGQSGAAYARSLDVTERRVGEVLREAEVLGCAYRTGRGRSTRWWLG